MDLGGWISDGPVLAAGAFVEGLAGKNLQPWAPVVMDAAPDAVAARVTAGASASMKNFFEGGGHASSTAQPFAPPPAAEERLPSATLPSVPTKPQPQPQAEPEPEPEREQEPKPELELEPKPEPKPEPAPDLESPRQPTKIEQKKQNLLALLEEHNLGQHCLGPARAVERPPPCSFTANLRPILGLYYGLYLGAMGV